jgi:hypothetical protein
MVLRERQAYAACYGMSKKQYRIAAIRPERPSRVAILFSGKTNCREDRRSSWDLNKELFMRSEINTSLPDDAFVVRLSRTSAMDMENRVRAERARIIGELLADAILWLVRLPRRLVDSSPAHVGAAKQRS